MALPQVMEATQVVEKVQVTEKTRVYEGTAAEILAVLQGNGFIGWRLRLIAEPEEDLSENLPDPPNTIRDRAHLEQMLMEGLSSPRRKLTAQDWLDIDQAVEDRIAARKQNT